MPITLNGDGAISGLTATGISAVQNLPAGSVLQVVNSTTGTLNTSSSSAWANTNLTAAITPKFATSRILITIIVTGCKKQNNNTYMGLRLVRNGSVVINFELEGGYTNNTAINEFGATGTTVLDSPASVSAQTYTVQLASISNLPDVSFNNSGSTSTITLMEIAA